MTRLVMLHERIQCQHYHRGKVSRLLWEWIYIILLSRKRWTTIRTLDW